MARSEKVMELVRKELEKNPDAETTELFEKAKKADSTVADLSLRQFNARYPLQVKRQKSRKQEAKQTKKKPAKRAKPEAADGRRAAIREGLLRFATDVVAAEDKAALIDVITSVDEYADEVAKQLNT